MEKIFISFPPSWLKTSLDEPIALASSSSSTAFLNHEVQKFWKAYPKKKNSVPSISSMVENLIGRTNCVGPLDTTN